MGLNRFHFHLYLSSKLPYAQRMGIFTLWLMWRNNKLLDQIRRNQLSPAERDAEDRAPEGLAEHAGINLLIILIIIVITVLSYR